jgi:hypothetical protein
LETPKCVPKKSFKIKILKDDVINDDPKIQYTNKRITKIEEYQGEPFKMRTFYMSDTNKCGRSSKTVLVIPKTTVYSDGRKVMTKVPLSAPSIKSNVKAIPLVSSAVKTLSSSVTTGLQEAYVFNDTGANNTVVSFETDVLRCLDGSYSSSQSFREVQSISDWFIILFVLATFIFTVVINSYWLILLSMFRSLKNVLMKQDQTCSDLKDVIGKLDGLTRISSQ